MWLMVLEIISSPWSHGCIFLVFSEVKHHGWEHVVEKTYSHLIVARKMCVFMCVCVCVCVCKRQRDRERERQRERDRDRDREREGPGTRHITL
jgi:hypothetical protein